MSLEVMNVSKSISGKRIIKNVTFSLLDNEIVALVGPNGAGKTTLLKLISNLIHLDEGTININGYNVQKNRKSYLNELSFMQDSSVLYPELTGIEHLNFIAEIKGKNSEDILNTVKKLDIEEYIHKKVKTYSLGMKQHLLLGIAILAQPRFLLLDEPLNGLDPTSSILLRNLLLDLRKQGTSILFSSHILSEVDKVSDRILFIRNGQIIAENAEVEKKSSYLFNISRSDKMVGLLDKQPYIKNIKKVNGNEVQLTLEDGFFNTIIKILCENSIDILDIKKTEYHTEELYKHLFEEKI